MNNYEIDKDRGHWTCELDGGIGTGLDKKSSSSTTHQALSETAGQKKEWTFKKHISGGTMRRRN